MVGIAHLNGHDEPPPLIMKLAMPVSPYPTFPRKREKGQTNRCASFTLTDVIEPEKIDKQCTRYA